MKKLSSLSAKERAAKAAKLSDKLDKKRQSNLGPGSKAAIEKGKAHLADKSAKAAAKKQGLPEEAAEGMRGYAWEKKHGKKPF